VFISFEGINQDNTVSLDVKINPLISFTWLGFLLLTAGTLVAVWPKRQSAGA
jgi:cytochrome c-type biogenesis protein CcmF